MKTIQILIDNINEELQEIIIAELSEVGFHGFEQNKKSLVAYVLENQFCEADYLSVLNKYCLNHSKEYVEPVNWNKQWESNFDPVVVSGFCTIRADFHDINIETPYEIIITPKMSFGTGHHATTKLMMVLMRGIDIEQKSVFDFGTGTGILAILASNLGAQNIFAIDNDEWSIENATENAIKNGVNIQFQLGSIEVIDDKKFDIVLANINRHILLEYMQYIFNALKKGGVLLMSGLLLEDEIIILEAVQTIGFIHMQTINENGWIAMKMLKQ